MQALVGEPLSASTKGILASSRALLDSADVAEARELAVNPQWRPQAAGLYAGRKVSDATHGAVNPATSGWCGEGARAPHSPPRRSPWLR